MTFILGITGTDGAGKGEVVNILTRAHGFAHYSAREFLVKEARRRGLGETRADLRRVGNALRAERGDDVLVRLASASIERDGAARAIVESVRALAEARALKERGGVLLAIDADPALRFERIASRGSSSDRISFEEFLAQEALEMDDADPHGMQKAAVMKLADHTIINNGTLEDLGHSVSVFIAAVARKKKRMVL
jgi:dephospho-CoA kinase